MVHLASVRAAVDATRRSAADVEMARRVLDAAGAPAWPTSSCCPAATVYGAWPTNPVPLTEDAPLRPNPGFAFAVQKAEIERLTAEWQDAHPGTTVTVLRPAPVADADDRAGWPGRCGPAARCAAPTTTRRSSSSTSTTWRPHRPGRPRRLDGVYNVAPDGWLPADEFRRSPAAPVKVRVPGRVVDRLGPLAVPLGLGPHPAGVLAYARGPWVVANDRLRAAGWRPPCRQRRGVRRAPGRPARHAQPPPPPGAHPQAAGAGIAAAVVGAVLAAAAGCAAADAADPHRRGAPPA